MAPSGAEREGGPAGADDDSDDDDGDEDATSAKQRDRRTEAVSYGPNDDEDDAIQLQLQRDTDDVEEGEERLGFVDEAYGGSPEPEEELGISKTDDERARSREARIKNKNELVSRFRCDEVGGEWVEFTLEFDASIPKILMLSLVQEAVRRSVIQQIQRLRNASFEPKKVKDAATGEERVTELLVHTEGANLRAMQQYGDYINPNRIVTNDIAQVLEVYGVEACRGTIVRELGDVFKAHGISVDPRHLNLIADYMTRNGGFTPFNRIGLTGNVSPFTKMSYGT
jgi:DNA-directed RNA polymerase I subunit RPA1